MPRGPNVCFVAGCLYCRNFDKNNIDAAVMKKIQTYTPQPEFQPAKVEKVGR